MSLLTIFRVFVRKRTFFFLHWSEKGRSVTITLVPFSLSTFISSGAERVPVHLAIGNQWLNTSQHEFAISLRVSLGHRCFNTRCVSTGGHQGAKFLLKGTLKQSKGTSRSTEEMEKNVFLLFFFFYQFVHAQPQQSRKAGVGEEVQMLHEWAQQLQGWIMHQIRVRHSAEWGWCDSCDIISPLGSTRRTLCFAPTRVHSHLLQLLHQFTSVLGPASTTNALHQKSKAFFLAQGLKKSHWWKRSEVIADLSWFISSFFQK